MEKKKNRNRVDSALLIGLLALIGIGVIMVLSASMYQSAYESGGNGLSLFIKQIIFIVIGLVIMALLSRIDYRMLKNKQLCFFIFFVTTVLLILVLVFGEEINGAKRWLNFGIGTFQPSELAKFAGIIYMAAVFDKTPRIGEKFGPFTVRCVIPMLILVLLIIIEPSMSSALTVCVAMGSIMVLSGTSWKILLPWIGLGLIAVVFFLIKEPWRLERIFVAFGGGTQDYQITQSLLAIASGGLTGKGLGNGIQKFLFLPELQNDFIFANIGEEFGFIGCILVILCYAFVIIRCIQIANYSKDRFGYLYTVAVAILMGYQVFVNIAVACAVIPVTGMALPFISAGGSSIIIFFIMMGPILNLSRKMGKK